MKTEIIEFKDTEIYCPVKNGEIYVAIKPICEALGVAANKQMNRIKSNEILSQLYTIVVAVGRDNKSRKMGCLPLQYIFGWLFTIDHTKVNDDVKDKVIDYKLECYNALYEHFVETGKNINRKEELLNESEQKIAEMEEQRKKLRKQIKDEKERFKQIALAPANQLDLFE